MHTLLWRRLDAEGHDVCRIRQTPEGFEIEGTAVFAHAGEAASLAYRILCDAAWRSRSATIAGWIGEADFTLAIARAGEGWRIDGAPAPTFAGLEDIDLGFTPASNLNAIRRLALPEGAEAQSVAVWLDTEDWTFKPLPQTYRRTGHNTYAYASPQHDYRATLTVDDFGAITHYPALWTLAAPR